MSQRQYKIVFAGPVGAGKSTAISAISDIQVVSTEALATDETRNLKLTTTVAMDFGVLCLNNGDQVHLYGTPGQERFDFMWDILTQGGLGLVLLVNNSAPNPISDTQQFLRHFGSFIKGTGVVIGITRTDICPQPSIDDYHAQLSTGDDGGCLRSPPPIFAVDARKPHDVRMLVEALLYTLDPGIVQ